MIDLKDAYFHVAIRYLLITNLLMRRVLFQRSMVTFITFTLICIVHFINAHAHFKYMTHFKAHDNKSIKYHCLNRTIRISRLYG